MSSRARDAHDQAADWLVRRQNPEWSVRDQADFDFWLNASDGNKAAYWRLKHSWDRADRIRALGLRSNTTRALFGKWIGGVAAAILVMIMGASYFVWPQFSAIHPVETRIFQTAVGGHEQLILAEGSKVELNTGSSLRTAISGRGREVWLEKGEAYFEVTHAPDHPFVVHAGDHKVTVLGTKFAVRRDNGKVVVSVVEGRVQLADDKEGHTSRLSILARGDRAVAQGNTTLVSSQPVGQIENALSWRSGMLTFDATPLEDVAAEFNRYNRVQILIVDPQAKLIPVGGRFPASKAEAFTRLLHDAYGLKVEVGASQIKVSR